MMSYVLLTLKFVQESIATQIKRRVQHSITGSTGIHDE